MSGAMSARGLRSSQLLYHWESRRLSLDAITGQVGSYYIEAGVVDTTHDVLGRNAVSASGGRWMPRWVQDQPDLVPRLAIAADLSGKDVEHWEAAWTHKVMPLSMLVRCWPYYAGGSSVAGSPWLILMGNIPDTSGGYLGIRRLTTTWQAIRIRGSGGSPPSIASNFTEPGSITYPVDLMVTLTAGGVIQLLSRDAAGAIQNGTASSADTNMMIPTETWGGAKLLMGAAGRYRMETIKIAMGVQTMASMDLLS